MDTVTRVNLAVHGVRVDAPVRRSKGAGPSDDGHLVLDGETRPCPSLPTAPT